MSRNPRFCFFLFLFLNSSVFFSIPCFSIDEQGQALLSWKSQLNISGNALSSWNAAASNPCKWVGIKCNARGQVSEIQLQVMDFQSPLPATDLRRLKSLSSLSLTSVNLTGSIPKELGDLPELEVLDLADNSLSGEIPVEIFKLKKLKTLSLNTNNLEGVIPSELGNLTSLVELTLFDNKLGGEIPKSIGELKNLEIFRAGGNKNLRGELPWEIGNCEGLVTLGLAETSLSGKLPASIGNLKHVRTIALYTSLLSGPIPDEIGNCTELRNLYLYQNSISGSIPTALGRLEKLQSLLLWQNNLVGKIPNELGNCPELFLIDLSENLLTGNIPRNLGSLLSLQELQLSVNQLSGTIPEELANCTKLTHLEIDNNRISGEIPPLIGELTSLTMFFAWSNQLTGNIPESLSQCEELQAIDLSYNGLTGSIPSGIFELRNLTKLLLLYNDLSGLIPPEIGNCTNLYRLRLNGNRITGNIPGEIGNLKNLNFIDISENRLMGNIPPVISGCVSLEFVDLHSNGLTGLIPGTLPKSLQLIDFSGNSLTGSLPSGIGSLTELTKLNLAKNRLSGEIPKEISSCRSLQLLNLGDNSFTGEIPDELGRITTLAISLNLSCNSFTGELPPRFSSLVNLGSLDISHNKLAGNLNVLADLQNLVSLNISFNDFSGELPNTLFFKKLPLSVLESNKGLFISARPNNETQTRHRSAVRLTVSILVAASVVLVLMAVYTLVKAQRVAGKTEELDTWEVTLYQKLDFSIDDIVKNLTSANVIGTGSSGVVYRVTIPSGETLAVKKMWPKEETGAFNSEINALGSIRHRYIIRLLGWCSNKNVKLLFYDYLPNGSLSSLLHGAGKGRGGRADWEARYDVVLGVAHALAYLHHDCLPPILHGDVKAMNVLLGSRFEPYLADFGSAKTVNTDGDSSKSSNRPPFAGSYGYMAPEHASMQRITEKSVNRKASIGSGSTGRCTFGSMGERSSSREKGSRRDSRPETTWTSRSNNARDAPNVSGRIPLRGEWQPHPLPPEKIVTPRAIYADAEVTRLSPLPLRLLSSPLPLRLLPVKPFRLSSNPSINTPQSISSLRFRFISLFSSFFIYCSLSCVQIKTLKTLKPRSIAMKPNGKSIVSSDYDDKVMFFKDVSLGHHESQLRFRLIHFLEAWNPLKKTLIVLEMLLIDEQGTAIQRFIFPGRIEKYLPEMNFRFHSYEEFQANCDLKGDIYGIRTYYSRLLDFIDLLSTLNYLFGVILLTLLMNNGIDVVGHMKLVNGQSIVEASVLDEVEIAKARRLLIHAARDFCKKFKSYEKTPTVLLVTTVNTKTLEGTLALTSMSSSHVFIDYDVQPTIDYFGWLGSNPDIAEQVNAEVKSLYAYTLSHDAFFECTTTIDDVVHGSAWYYIACSGCHTKVTKGPTSMICTNSKCGKVNVAGAAQYRSKISVYDNSDQAFLYYLVMLVVS
ncbi:unnamed protein product [Brassica oleracea var. botrytis]